MIRLSLMKTLAFSCLVMSSLAACGSGQGAKERAALTSAIKHHYAAHATEEQGGCRTPKIDTILQHHLLEPAADGQDVMMVRYSYFDRHADMDANLDRFISPIQTCGGISEREFKLNRSLLGYEVIAMSGERRGKQSRR